MIESTLTWISNMNQEYNIKPVRVLDIGSWDYNGNPRHLFPDSKYIGIDIKDGPNVDEVVDAYDLYPHFKANHFDAVLCLHLFEHLKYIHYVLEEIDVVLIQPGGYLYVAMPTLGYPKHEYPKDYWRITEDTMREVIMDGYEILSLEHAKSKFGKHPIINCLGIKI